MVDRKYWLFYQTQIYSEKQGDNSYIAIVQIKIKPLCSCFSEKELWKYGVNLQGNFYVSVSFQ